MRIIEHKYFDPLVMAMIVLNAVAFSFVWVGIDPYMQEVMGIVQE